jgi:hypothetical protein
LAVAAEARFVLRGKSILRARFLSLAHLLPYGIIQKPADV